MTLAAEDLAFGFADRAVGRGVSLALARGEAHCLLGPNGSGKTTLLRTLCGLLPALSGRVMLEGRALASWPDRERARRIAYVPQWSETPFDFSVLEIVEMGRVPHRGLFEMPGAHDRERAREALQRLRIEALAARPIHRVSGGERQLALIARALATEADILLMDEPTANLDFANQSRVLDEIARLRAAGSAVLFSTHHPDHALRIADRAVLLREGRVIASGDPLSAVNSENLSALYGQRIDVVEVACGQDERTRVCVARAGARFD